MTIRGHGRQALLWLLVGSVVRACGAEAVADAADGPRSAAAEPGELVVVQWNVENLFDTLDDPANRADDGYMLNGWAGWTEARYRRKLNHLADVLGPLKADIVCVQEVENQRVLEHLAAALRERHGWEYPHIVHREGTDHRGIEVALLSRYAPRATRWLTPVAGQRDIVIAEFQIARQPLTIIVNHWKSRWGPQREGTEMRMAQAAAARGEIERILSANATAAVMLVGDFNDDCDGPAMAEGVGSVTDLKRVRAEASGMLLYNLHGELRPEKRGTLYYHRGGTWSSFDSMSVSRIMVNSAAKGYRGWRVRPETYEVVRSAEMLDPEGIPLPFRRLPKTKKGDRKYVEGYSDHLPVRVVLTRSS